MQAEFVLSAAGPGQFIRDDMPKVAFAGRSNVGKSSVINRLVGMKNLARVGSAPGKTSHVNYFRIDGCFYLVDLPGYGYAKVSKTEKERWAKLMEAYFAETGQITLGVMIVDIRHKPTQLDQTMAGFFQQTCLPWLVIANKTDKLKPSQIPAALELIRETLVLDPGVPLLPMSGEKGTGRQEAWSEIEKRLSGSLKT